MKRTVLEYKEYGNTVYLKEFKNVATGTDLAYYFIKKCCGTSALEEYLYRRTTRDDHTEDVSYVLNFLEDCIHIRYLNTTVSREKMVRSNTFVTREEFAKLIHDLQKGGERLEKIVAKYQKETKEVTI